MINLRYHVVSITAVFLALGIGLAFGAAFIDQATVDVLDARLDNIEHQNVELEQRNAALEAQLDRLGDVEEQLRGAGLPAVLQGRLEEIPVLVLAVRGVDESAVAAAAAATVAAGARPAGVLWLTDRWLLDDDAELDDLAAAVGVAEGSADGLRRTARRQLALVLTRAAAVSVGEEPIEDELEPTTPTTPVTGLPDLVQRLLDTGFLEFDEPASGPPDVGLFGPSAGLRLLVVSGPGASVPDALVLLPIVQNVSIAATVGPPGPVVVAAQRGPDFDAAPPDGADPEEERVVFVGPIRDDDLLATRVSTVDDLETFAGLVATVLALEHGADAQFGHYGIGAGAQSLTPALVDAGGEGDG